MEFPEYPQGVQLSPGGAVVSTAPTKRQVPSGGAVVSARLCRLPEQELHQPSGRCILIGAIYSVGALETSAPPN